MPSSLAILLIALESVRALVPVPPVQPVVSLLVACNTGDDTACQLVGSGSGDLASGSGDLASGSGDVDQLPPSAAPDDDDDDRAMLGGLAAGLSGAGILLALMLWMYCARHRRRPRGNPSMA